MVRAFPLRDFGLGGIRPAIRQDAQSIWEIDLTGPTALILGSEGSGLHRLVKERCDYVAALPIRGAVGSYNVSVAAGIALYEVIRQRALSSK